MATNLRKLARDKECQIRGPMCNFDDATTVLAHLNGGGMGRKRSDLAAAWACSECHSWADGRNMSNHPGEAASRELHHYRGVIRTLENLEEMGVVCVV